MNEFKPDYGLTMSKLGFKNDVEIPITDFSFDSITPLGNNAFSTTIEYLQEGVTYALSIDYTGEQLKHILSDTDEMETILKKVNDPFITVVTVELKHPIIFDLVARLGKLQTAQQEQFIPLILQEVIFPV
jgi:hypothetical protein